MKKEIIYLYQNLNIEYKDSSATRIPKRIPKSQRKKVGERKKKTFDLHVEEVSSIYQCILFYVWKSDNNITTSAPFSLFLLNISTIISRK